MPLRERSKGYYFLLWTGLRPSPLLQAHSKHNTTIHADVLPGDLAANVQIFGTCCHVLLCNARGTGTTLGFHTAWIHHERRSVISELGSDPRHSFIVDIENFRGTTESKNLEIDLGMHSLTGRPLTSYFVALRQFCCNDSGSFDHVFHVFMYPHSYARNSELVWI